jgi:hypothetical protein
VDPGGRYSNSRPTLVGQLKGLTTEGPPRGVHQAGLTEGASVTRSGGDTVHGSPPIWLVRMSPLENKDAPRGQRGAVPRGFRMVEAG